MSIHASRANRVNAFAFSLIELLVVVAIIVILLAILVPSLSRAMTHAEAALCGTNESAIGKALALYLADSKRRFPVLFNYNGLLGNLGNTATLSSDHHGAWDRPLNPYLGYTFIKDVDTPVRVARCPSDAGDSFLGFENAYEAFGVSYMPQMAYDDFRTKHVFGWNGHGMSPVEQVTAPLPADARASLRESAITRPDNKLIVADWPWHGDRLYSEERTRWHGPEKRKFNTLFADSHVEFFYFDPKEIESNGSTDAANHWQTPYSKSFKWW